MPRPTRSIVGGMVCHVLNRAAAGGTLFEKPEHFQAFQRVLQETHEREPLRILAYCVMPDHWHLVLWPRRGRDDQVSEFMRRLTLAHTRRRHAHFRTTGTGPVYQGRFKSFPVQDDAHLWKLIRYVEGSPKRAGLVRRAEDWRWSSLWCWAKGDADAKRILSSLPATAGRRPRDWKKLVNHPQTQAELEVMRNCVKRGSPFGGDRWIQRTATRLDLESTLRPRGRPRKTEV